MVDVTVSTDVVIVIRATVTMKAIINESKPMRKTPRTFQERSKLRKMLIRAVLRFISPQRSSLRTMRKWMSKFYWVCFFEGVPADTHTCVAFLEHSLAHGLAYQNA
jgi:hypothetical protein